MPASGNAEIKPLTGRSRDFLETVLPAASTGKLLALQQYLRQEPRFLNAIGPHGRTILWEAARKGKLDVVRYLVGEGADLGVRGCYFRDTKVEVTPWCVALIEGRQSVVAFLEASGAGCSFDSACFLGDLEQVKIQLNADPSLCDRPVECGSDEINFRPIHYAVAGEQFSILKELISRGADARDDGERLVSSSIDHEDTSILECLLKHGARPRAGDANEASLDPRLEAIFYAYGYEFDINAPDRLGFPPLVEACRGNHNAKDNPEEAKAL